jgi:tRNA-splicing ligase RtcB
MKIIPKDEAVAILPSENESLSPITVIGTESIRGGFDGTCLRQAQNCRSAPGVSEFVLNPDAHAGYGAPVGSVLVSPTHIYPGPVGVDIKCSMSLLQFDIPADVIAEKSVRRALINAISERTPTGAGQGARSVKKGRHVEAELGKKIVTEGASREVLNALGIPVEWALRCEDAFHLAHDGTSESLAKRLEQHISSNVVQNFPSKILQLGSYGGGNHFGEANITKVSSTESAKKTARVFGLQDNCVSFLSHCGSRGFGNILAGHQFKTLQNKFKNWNTPFPGNDRELVYAPLGSPEANDYLDDMALGANFATVNHMLINALILEAFQEVIPGATGKLVYFISHNIARKEIVKNKECWVHRKGATRAFHGDHFSLKGTEFEGVGHPILLPGNPVSGSAIMVAEKGAELSCFSVNHGAGRAMGRTQAKRSLNQKQVNEEFDERDILSNCRNYPVDEAPAAYKDFNEVLRSVEIAGLATTVAKLKARFVIKDGDTSLGGAG